MKRISQCISSLNELVITGELALNRESGRFHRMGLRIFNTLNKSTLSQIVLSTCDVMYWRNSFFGGQTTWGRHQMEHRSSALYQKSETASWLFIIGCRKQRLFFFLVCGSLILHTLSCANTRNGRPVRDIKTLGRYHYCSWISNL